MKYKKLLMMPVTLVAAVSIFSTPIFAQEYRLNKYDTDFTKSFTYTSSTHGFTDYYRSGFAYNGNAENKKSVAVTDWAY